MNTFLYFIISYIIFLFPISYGVRRWTRRGQVLAAIVATAIFAVGTGFLPAFFKIFEWRATSENLTKTICQILRKEDRAALPEMAVPEVAEALNRFAWPGNFRVLESEAFPEGGICVVFVKYYEYNPDTGCTDGTKIDFIFDTNKKLVGIKWDPGSAVPEEEAAEVAAASYWYNQ